jgi:hypothetical protein
VAKYDPLFHYRRFAFQGGVRVLRSVQFGLPA